MSAQGPSLPAQQAAVAEAQAEQARAEAAAATQTAAALAAAVDDYRDIVALLSPPRGAAQPLVSGDNGADEARIENPRVSQLLSQ